MSRTARRHRLPAIAGALLAVALAAGACADTADDGGDSPAVSSADVEGGGASGAEAPGEAAAMADRDGGGSQPDAAQEPLLISTGTVSLRSDDVAQDRFEVQKIVDRAGGTVSQEETRTDDDGLMRTSRMVLRVPSDAFAATVEELEGIDERVTVTTTSEDVTTQVIDNRVRIRVQRASIRRIEALLERAQAIGDVVRIESELSRRQAELNSLLRRQAYLTDQTSLSTITVHLERALEPGNDEDTDDAGFLNGLDAGWSALSTFAVALVTVLGALLPWLGVLLVLALPLWWLRRARRRRMPTPPAPAEG